ncbi:[FeFe] hydrogenase H-cluster radical SAM maturase HydE [Ruminococcus sp.]|uniref:[FeFe] hydrogenase H-cluster radical SAM maturase HydE n=1 Tax=Ruminococcus sp. TaxID=41978 RepID=UPI0025DE3942|nr:[FeFe] hydrogenase H-cluster radical SAM maturase HydE [Ruminococcus sp.]MBQ6250397.1 [FeFe] hydrogenase H-cluster radical SAM maturase HydE [Ruminococcus sp.]MBR6995699.1 [FeFe] hydrogenase H-cluster radical SAM maturase HydE [Ruminococcus sp.]
MTELVEKLYNTGDLSDSELKALIETDDSSAAELLRRYADETRQKSYGKKVFLRGLIEVSSYCRNDCLYCGIRRSNKEADRYRLSREEIMSCCENGYGLGFRTFVMQGGEDSFFTDDFMCSVISEIKEKYPDCAVTLSLGERSYDSYKRMKEAGADRYLLRHEAASEELYSKLHPAEMSLAHRKECLFQLRELGYQVGAGFMVGAPHQTTDHIIADLRFLQELRPQMIGIGPFVPHHNTPFAEESGGTLTLTLRLLGILRLMFPKVLLPATTALGTIAPNGRELGLKTGCNVVMPNLSPVKVRKKYDLYDNKICTGEEAAECRGCLQRRIESAGYEVSAERGDCI